jgi:hypothetical protein
VRRPLDALRFILRADPEGIFVQADRRRTDKLSAPPSAMSRPARPGFNTHDYF